MGYQWIKKKLEKNNRSQAELARAIGLTSDKLNKIFAGTRDFKPSEIIKVARFFSISAEEVITGNAPVSPDLHRLAYGITNANEAIIDHLARLEKKVDFLCFDSKKGNDGHHKS